MPPLEKKWWGEADAIHQRSGRQATFSCDTALAKFVLPAEASIELVSPAEGSSDVGGGVIRIVPHSPPSPGESEPDPTLATMPAVAGETRDVGHSAPGARPQSSHGLLILRLLGFRQTRITVGLPGFVKPFWYRLLNPSNQLESPQP